MSEIIMIVLYAVAAYLAIGLLAARFSKLFYIIFREIEAKPGKPKEILLIFLWPFVLSGEILSVILCILAVISSICAFVFGCVSYLLANNFLKFLYFFFGKNTKKKRLKLSPDIMPSESSEDEIIDLLCQSSH